ncbi:tripartite tricarboxylate transporter substrate binding protein [Roseomonas sp. M0104]|uniref:Tripartite tricarboxylate transporter substrate binding protein n=1 Tax=Teichococcus coralli TaxID=2545983 RepID=A0A845BGL6_9PROT|nr:tripartite tricarboxylate transporter substrate binding protein [Pseudoroseomonas coralli]MXP65256.1 tripartite tricarboxylate transporter substrate binding protein [Pseudoroseomonas coralli]
MPLSTPATPLLPRRRLLLAGAGLALGALARPALAASSYPSRPVRIVVPWAPGGAVDVVARRMAQKLSARLGQPFVVENKPGATGTIGAADVARSDPDGQTLLAIDNTYATLPYLFNNLPFDHAGAFAPVSVSAFSPVLLLVNAKSPYKDLASLIAAAKREPNKITFGSGGVGSSLHLSAEAFQQAAGVKLFHVPYKGGGEAVTATISGEVDMAMPSLGSGLGGIKGGLLRPLAISGEHRVEALPDTPTFGEAGLKGFSIINWSGLAAPRGTPQPVIDQLYQAMAASLRDEDMLAFLKTLAAEPGGMPPAEFAKLIQREKELWAEVAKSAGIERQ